ncbi:MAG: twin-arginine translocase subunit TatC [Deltaproteobacteria bacterium]|nr:twin-arginine translocase subunit TatC [Deltaproteobacteria bacterium]
MSNVQSLIAHLESSRAGTLFKRVDEVRSMLVKWVSVFLVFVAVGFYFAQDLINFLKIPLADALPGQAQVLHFTGPLEVMMAYMKVAFVAAFLLALPLGFFQIWRFMISAFPERDHRLTIPFFVSSLLLFGLGVIFCYFVMLPVGLKWLVGFGGDQADAIITVGEYVDMLVFMIIAFGLAFQLPLVIILVERLGLVQEVTLKKHRGGILVGILTAAAVIAPSPDPMSQVALAIPMYLMFEAALLVIGRMKRQKPQST